MVTVAVGVAVVALGTGVVGCFLQPHQHVHLWREQRGQSACQFAGKPTLASLEILPPAPDSSRAHGYQERLWTGAQELGHMPASQLTSCMSSRGYLDLSGIYLLAKQ